MRGGEVAPGVRVVVASPLRVPEVRTEYWAARVPAVELTADGENVVDVPLTRC